MVLTLNHEVLLQVSAPLPVIGSDVLELFSLECRQERMVSKAIRIYFGFALDLQRLVLKYSELCLKRGRKIGDLCLKQGQGLSGHTSLPKDMSNAPPGTKEPYKNGNTNHSSESNSVWRIASLR